MTDWKRRRAVLLAIACAFMSACASGPKQKSVDPLEPMNRFIYGINEGVDMAVVEPTAKLYRFVLPTFVRSSIGNAFSNVTEIRNVLNNALQGKLGDASSSFGRLAINSTIGVLGLFDVAGEAGLEKREEDFGQTLGRWGFGDGPFIMLPFFGPSTVRDTIGWGVDIYSDPLTYVNRVRTRNQIWIWRTVQRRSELLDAKKIIDAAALDEYQFVRDGYLQRRRNLVYDGKPPAGKDLLVPAPGKEPPGPPPKEEPPKR